LLDGVRGLSQSHQQHKFHQTGLHSRNLQNFHWKGLRHGWIPLKTYSEWK
jgi:hypothetical protein